jgi:hypothetical protein
MLRSFCPIVALVVLTAQSLAAQANTSRDSVTTVSGVVLDSLANAPLQQATIQLIQPDNPAFVRNATSDSLGRFELTRVPLGHYKLGFIHPILDSLGMEAPLRDVYVNSFNPLTANLAVPSAGTLRRAVCGPGSSSGAVIVGTVRDAQSGSAIPKATVTGDWYEYTLARTGMSPQLRRRTAQTSDNGWFALCNVPSSGSVALLATTGSDSTGTIEVDMAAEGFVRRELYLGAMETESANAVSTSPGAMAASRRIRTGNGHLTGTVTTVVGNRPLANAQVSIVEGPSTHTDSHGDWSISNAPGGTQMLEVRALGFYPEKRNVNVVAGGAPLQISLSTLKAVLDTVRIRASRLPNDINGTGFNTRRRSGAGRYVTPEDLQRLPVIVTSQIFRRMPGLKTDTDTIMMRGAFATWCAPAIFIDDRNVSFLTKDELDDYVQPEHILGIEVYSEGSAPVQFQNGMGGCGSIVIWTK